MSQRTAQRPTTGRGRFARPSASPQRAAGGLGRRGRPSSSSQGAAGGLGRLGRPSSSSQGASGGLGRLGRPSASPQRAGGGLGRLGRPQPSPSRKGRPSRRSQRQSGAGKLMSGLMGALPGGGGRKRSRGSAMGKGAGGLAALAGVAGLAFKNRDKLAGRRGGDEHESHVHAAPSTTGVPPAGL